MFGDINEVNLMGNVTEDVEAKFTPAGNAVINFSIATNRSYKQDDEWKDEVAYHNITCWRNAENLAKRIKKGTRVHVHGRLMTRSWQKDGETKYRTEIIANRILLIDRYVKFDKNEPPIEAYEEDAKSEIDNTEMVEDTLK